MSTRSLGELGRGIRAALPVELRRGLKRVRDLLRAPLARVRLGIGVPPLSREWGSDRGMPIHRYYMEQFLAEYAADIRGRCLEFQEDRYTSRFGGSRVARVDVLHRDPGNPHATIVADLTQPNDIPSNLFDCVVCTHVLDYIFDLGPAVAEMHRILAPGGTLLVAVPHISKFDARYGECWRFTPEGLSRVLSRSFGQEHVLARAYGNSLTAAGEIRGLVAGEFAKATLDVHDDGFAVEVCARAVKARRPLEPRDRTR